MLVTILTILEVVYVVLLATWILFEKRPPVSTIAWILALIALALGTTAAWYVIVQIFEFDWAPDWAVMIGTLAGGAILTLGIGLAGSWPLLSVRPASALRQL